MRLRSFSAAFVCTLLLAAGAPQSAAAQDEEPTPIVYGVYLTCDASATERASEIIRDSWGPLAQARVDAGDLMAWGSATHHSGGSWSRILYHVAMDRAQLFTSVEEMVVEWQETAPEAAAEFWGLCDEHEDYVWTYVNGSRPAEEVAQERPTAGISVYWVCDEGRGPLIDLLAEEVFAEAWNAQVEAGLVDSWSWYSHFIGDKYRRLLVTDGATHNDLLTARDNVLEWVGDNKANLAGEFSNVCNGHVDYLWNIEISSP